MKEIKPILPTLSSAHKCYGIAFVVSMGILIMKTKKCGICKETKSNSLFYKNKRSYDGLQYVCVTCSVISRFKYDHSKKGLITKIYADQKYRSKLRSHDLPTYTKEELKEWLLGQKLFHELYDNWVLSDYDKCIKPSVDRPDDYKGYSLDNIKLMTWGENDTKGNNDMINGINNKKSRAVVQYNLDGSFKKEYYSMSQAERETEISQGDICSVCNKKRKTAGKFIWEYKNN